MEDGSPGHCTGLVPEAGISLDEKMTKGWPLYIKRLTIFIKQKREREKRIFLSLKLSKNSVFH